MILPVADALRTPCLTSRMNPAARKQLKDKYCVAKLYGIKAAWGVVTGSDVLELAKEIAKGEVVKHGKKKIESLILLGCTHFGTGALTLVTNSTKLLNYTKKAHIITSCIYLCAHDASEVSLIALDFIVFGEYVPSCPDDRYQLFDINPDALNEFID